jgi:glutamate dehydrogenase
MAPKKAKLQAFLKRFLPNVKEELLALAMAIYNDFPISNLKEIGPANILKTLTSCFNLLQERKAGEFKLNINHLEGHDEYNIIEVVADNIPFLVESISNELRRQNYNIHYVVHDTVSVKRDSNGKLIGFAEGKNETIMQFVVSYYAENQEYSNLAQRLLEVLNCVAYAVADWQPMRKKMQQAIDNLAKLDSITNKSEVMEFLSWLVNNNFIFLGFAQVSLLKGGKQLQNDMLGILKSELYPLNNQQISVPNENDVLKIRKSEYRSIVHRTSNMDSLFIANYDESGQKVTSVLFFLGFFTSSVYYQSVRNIPLMRTKVNNVLTRYGYDENSHNAKELITAVEAFPRGELLQMSEDELYEIATEIVALGLIPRVRIFIRRDTLSNFLSCLIFIPKNKFSTAIVNLIEKTIEQKINGKIARQYLQVGESQLARLQFIVRVDDVAKQDIDLEHIEKLIIDATSSWDENLHKELLNQLPRQHANNIYEMVCGGFDIKYTSTFSVQHALEDICNLEKSIKQEKVFFDISSNKLKEECFVQLKVYTADNELPLSSTLPVIETLGFYGQDVIIHEVKLKLKDGERSAFIHVFRLCVNDEKQSCIEITPQRKHILEELLNRIWSKQIEDDRFNSLALLADLEWQEVIIMRAYFKYIKQLSFPFGQDYVIEALLNNKEICRDLVLLFKLKFSPNDEIPYIEIDNLQQKLLANLAEVQNLAEDKVLRMYLQVIMATKRTNFYQYNPDGSIKDYISFKIKSGELQDIPLPKPKMEIFVYSPRFEAVHLRGVDVANAEKNNKEKAKKNNFHIVARGGLRWSDRREDFRTEILGLLKAQMTKNAIIVPIGSKGGFVLKALSPQATRDEFLHEGIECYQSFLRGMLDITDNIINGAIVPPSYVMRHDGDDPYLVVAADKGTATFSDYANQVSAEYNFWLGDAFASGGSAGYDHKKMGITAKGAWVSVEKHFAELGMDIQNCPFTVVGIGDMSGDVFGNGMLLSKQIKLVAAFNHMHIFLDPNPEPSISYQERQRLFNLPRSQWSDYNPELISQGGGVFSRKAKSIPLSAEVREVLGVSVRSLTPDELIKTILKAPVDLLWNGGIGTYVKASYEVNENIGDKNNDSLRVNANLLRCRVLAEGGNLGCTQRGRIEFAQNGGRINTDFIDNSAGVDCSDHEVNIKIAFADIMHIKNISLSERNALLTKMEPEVERLVLLDNYAQNQLLTIEELWGESRIGEHAWLIKQLETSGELDRQLECLPSIDEIGSLINTGTNLPRPSISVLIAYAKNSIYQKLCNYSFVEDGFFENCLTGYFPVELRKEYKDILLGHKLSNEIIATVLTNDFVNKMGCCFMHQLLDESAYSPKDVMKAYMLVMQLLNLTNLWHRVEMFTGEITVNAQISLFRKLQEVIGEGMLWLLRNFTDIAAIRVEDLASYQQGIEILKKDFDRVCGEEVQQKYISLYVEYEGMPEVIPLVQEIAKLYILAPSFTIIKLSNKYSVEVTKVAELYFKLEEKMQINWLLSLIHNSNNRRYVDNLALKNLALRIKKLQGKLIGRELKMRHDLVDKKIVIEEKSIHFASSEKLNRYNEFIQELKTSPANSLVSTITIAVARAYDMFLA